MLTLKIVFCLTNLNSQHTHLKWSFWWRLRWEKGLHETQAMNGKSWVLSDIWKAQSNELLRWPSSYKLLSLLQSFAKMTSFDQELLPVILSTMNRSRPLMCACCITADALVIVTSPQTAFQQKADTEINESCGRIGDWAAHVERNLIKTHGPISFLVMNQNKPFSLQKSRVHRHLHHIEMNGNWFSISKLWPTSKVHHPTVLLTSQEFQTSIHLHRGIGPQQKHRPWQQHQLRPLRNVEPTGDQQLIPWCKVEKNLKATEVYST